MRFKLPKGGHGFNIIDLDEDELYSWGVYRMCTMLHAAYTISFLCMLRFDEVLNIEAYYIEVLDETRETGEIRLSLPFRKTHQLGGKYSIYLRIFRGFVTDGSIYRDQALPLVP